MLPWLIYVLCAGVVVGAAGALAERGIRHLGWPSRWVWLGAMAGTVAVGAGAWPRADPSIGLGSIEALVLVAWASSSVVMLTALRLSAWTLRRNGRVWGGGRVEGHRVHVSTGFGPGVVGALRPRIVLPRWVLDSDASIRRLIVRHESEHILAGDSRLLLAGLGLVALMPWSLPLWWQLRRLRQAIELDCDARVIRGASAAADYARALIAVAGRRAEDLSPVLALGPSVAELEQRIRLVTAGTRERSGVAGAACLAAAALAIGVLATVPAPAPWPPAPAVAPDARPTPGPAPEATIIFSVPPSAPERPFR